jgi:hypothetical protein
VTTLAASFIWGINTLFLLSAGLSNTGGLSRRTPFYTGRPGACSRSPTGVVADVRGRRFSFLLGAGTLMASTLLYYAIVADPRAVLRLGGGVDPARPGFTFFSGATEAWLVDALAATGGAGASTRSSVEPRR